MGVDLDKQERVGGNQMPIIILGKENRNMKVAVSAGGRDLDSQIDPRFGRCAYFLIVETDDISYEVFDNESIATGGGAGISAAQFVDSKGARAVITGNCGPNAVQTLRAAGIELFVGQSGSVRECVERFRRNGMNPTTEPNVADHHGMGDPLDQAPAGGMGAGMGRGTGGGGGRGMGGCGGRGMGGGRGRGMGGGMGRGMGGGRGMAGSSFSDQTDSGMTGRTQEISSLKVQATGLMKQMEEIQARIRKLEEI